MNPDGVRENSVLNAPIVFGIIVTIAARQVMVIQVKLVNGMHEQFGKSVVKDKS